MHHTTNYSIEYSVSSLTTFAVLQKIVTQQLIQILELTGLPREELFWNSVSAKRNSSSKTRLILHEG